MKPGVYKYVNIEHLVTNDYGKPISMITFETKEGVKMIYYGPASSYWELKKCTGELSHDTLIVMFYKPTDKITKDIFKVYAGYAGDLSHDEMKQMIARMTERELNYLTFPLRDLFFTEQKQH